MHWAGLAEHIFFGGGESPQNWMLTTSHLSTAWVEKKAERGGKDKRQHTTPGKRVQMGGGIESAVGQKGLLQPHGRPALSSGQQERRNWPLQRVPTEGRREGEAGCQGIETEAVSSTSTQTANCQLTSPRGRLPVSSSSSTCGSYSQILRRWLTEFNKEHLTRNSFSLRREKNSSWEGSRKASQSKAGSRMALLDLGARKVPTQTKTDSRTEKREPAGKANLPPT